MKTGIQIAAIASILIAGAGAFWVFGQRSPMTVDMPETAAAIEVANIRPGMQVSAADLVALGDGWQAGLNSGHRIADSGLMRADRMYSRLSDDTIEALGIDYVRHPSGRWVTSVHYAVLRGGMSKVGGDPDGALAEIDARHDEMIDALEAERGSAPFQRTRDLDAWLMCCEERVQGWDNGIGVRLREGIGFRMMTVGWNRNDLVQAVDAQTGVGTQWANDDRIAVEGTGQEALDRMMRAGGLRPATHEDGRAWLADHMAWAGDVIREVAGDRPERLRKLIGASTPPSTDAGYDAYVVRKPLAGLPQDFSDGRPRQFIVPEGVPLPGGDWGAHEVYVMGAGVCRTGDGQCTGYARIFQAWHMMKRNSDSDRDAVIAVAARSR